VKNYGSSIQTVKSIQVYQLAETPKHRATHGATAIFKSALLPG